MYDVKNLYDIQRGDTIITINGDVLKVRRASHNWVYGDDINRDNLFMMSRTQLEKLIKEVYYA